MPPKNIELIPTYVREGYVTKYHVYMYSAECLVETSEYSNWVTDAEFEEGSIAYIRPTTIPFGWRFNGWQGETDEETATVNSISSENTYLRIADFDIHMTATIIEEAKYTMKINNGQTSGEYYGGARVDVYFDKENTNSEHYTFIRWTGDVSGLELYDGGSFDVTKAGTSNEPQYVKMPPQRIEITAEYTATYHLVVNGGHITGTEDEYFAPGATVNITADVEEGTVFQKWIGNTDGIANVYDPTTTVTFGEGAKEITAVYSNIADRNNIGYGLTNLILNDTIDIEDITVISGEISIGFILTDTNTGHIYLVTNVNQDTVQVTKMTRTVKGGNIYE